MSKNISEIEDFTNLIRQFRKNHKNLTTDNLSFMCRKIAEDLSTKRYVSINNYNDRFSDSDRKDFSELHEEIVNKIIKFINEHPQIKEISKEISDELEKEWNDGIDDPKLHIHPDLNVNIYADALLESAKHGEWTPMTDSCMELDMGNRTIIISA